jgi:hypothetical protein
MSLGSNFLIGIISLAHSANLAEEPKHLLQPKVVQMDLVHYPAAARAAGVSGVVHFLVETDGKRVIRIIQSDGPPLLVKDLSRQISTWQFEPHCPTRFQVTFKMSVVRKNPCEPCDPDEIKLVLPSYVEITTCVAPECDPVVPKTP